MSRQAILFVSNNDCNTYINLAFVNPLVNEGVDAVKLGGLPYSYESDNCGRLRILIVGSATAEPVPEPASWALMIVGFGLVGVVTRRRSVAVAA